MSFSENKNSSNFFSELEVFRKEIFNVLQGNKIPEDGNSFIGLSFSEALGSLKEDEKVSRESWDFGIYLIKIIGDSIRKSIYDNYKEQSEKFSSYYEVKDFFIKVNRNTNTMEIYYPSQEDLLAEDFYIL